MEEAAPLVLPDQVAGAVPDLISSVSQANEALGGLFVIIQIAASYLRSSEAKFAALARCHRLKLVSHSAYLLPVEGPADGHEAAHTLRRRDCGIPPIPGDRDGRFGWPIQVFENGIVRRLLPCFGETRGKSFSTEQAPAQRGKLARLQQPHLGRKHGDRRHREPASQLFVLDQSGGSQRLFGEGAKRRPCVPAGKQVMDAEIERQIEILGAPVASMIAKALGSVLHV